VTPNAKVYVYGVQENESVTTEIVSDCPPQDGCAYIVARSNAYGAIEEDNAHLCFRVPSETLGQPDYWAQVDPSTFRVEQPIDSSGRKTLQFLVDPERHTDIENEIWNCQSVVQSLGSGIVWPPSLRSSCASDSSQVGGAVGGAQQHSNTINSSLNSTPYSRLSSRPTSPSSQLSHMSEVHTPS
jgi:hypothetical protein